MSSRKIAVIVGILFFVQMITFMIGSSLIQSFLDGDASKTTLSLGVILEICSGVAVVVIGLLIYQVLKVVNKRLALGMAFSLLIHLLFYFISSIFLLQTSGIRQEKQTETLEVRITPTSVPKPQAGLPNNSLISNTLRQEVLHAPHQLKKAEKTRQQSSRQTQLLALQLKQLLAKVLDVQPVATGKCLLVISDAVASGRMKCDSSALYEVISNNQKDMVKMLTELRDMGRPFNGFSSEVRKDKLIVNLIEEGDAASQAAPVQISR